MSSTLTITGAVNNSDVTLNDGSVVFECHADGHPSSTYRWLDISSGTVTNGPEYTISKAGEYSLECTASNNVTFANGSTIPHSVSTRFDINGMCQFLSTLYNIVRYLCMFYIIQYSRTLIIFIAVLKLDC